MKTDIVPMERIREAILFVRGLKVMLDRDLAMLYGVETRALNQAVKRNRDRFPCDFMFELTREEIRNISQSVTCSSTMKHAKSVYAFTEQGVAMLSSVLNSPRAIQVNIASMRAFVQLRVILSTHADLQPIEADRRTHEQLTEAAKILGLRVLDHVIVTRKGYFSFQENGLIR
jgi:DNA repair protein RadC